MVTLKWRRRLSYVSLGLFYFMSGVEYAVILPTLWLYLKTDFHAKEYMLGLLLSGYSFAAILSGPVLGRWADISNSPKVIVLAGIVVEVVGSIMYFMGISVWFLLASRMVAGVGGGAEAVILAEVTRTSDEGRRTGIISILVAIRQAGLLIGPGLNLFLREIDFHVNSFHINKYNVPGAFMACVWLLEILVVAMLYTDLHKLKTPPNTPSAHSKFAQPVIKENIDRSRTDYDEDIYKQLNSHSSRSPINSDISFHSSGHDADDLMESAENFMKRDSPNEVINHVCARTETDHATVNGVGGRGGEGSIETDYGVLENSLVVPVEERRSRQGSHEYVESTDRVLEDYLHGKSKLHFIYREYVREEIVTVIAVQFNSFFNQLAMETMATPLTYSLLDWGELENSIMYCLAGVEIILVFGLVTYLSKRLQDRLMIVIGLIILTIATAWLLYVLHIAKPHSPHHNLWMFVVGLALDMLALPFLVSCSVSLYSKITRKETQGLSMGIRRSVVGMATILAPLWASSTLHWPNIMCGVMLGLSLMSLVMISVSYTKLQPLSEMPINRAGLITDTYSEEEDSERRPLLS